MTRAKSAAPRKDEATGTWWFVVDVGVDEHGQRRQTRRRGFKTRKAAQEALDGLRVSVTRGAYVAPAKMRLGEYLGQWLDGLPTSGIRASTIDGYRRNLEGYVIPELGGVRLEALTAGHFDRLYSKLLDGGRRQAAGGLSPRSVRYIHTTVSKALADAVKKGELARNVAALADPPSPKSTKAPEMVVWTPGQLRTFLDFTAGEPLGPLFHLAAMTGMRRGEVCGVRWSDVDLDGARLEVRQQLLTISHRLVFSERTKTDHGRRPVRLDPSTVNVLRVQRSRQAAHRLAVGAGYRDAGLVFAEPDGSPLNPESVAKVFYRREARVNVPRIRFHDLRHTHVAHLILAAEQPLLISKRLGHSSTSFTMDRYGHLFPQAESQAADAVGGLIFGAV